MTYIILQGPQDGYYWLVKATSNKHFELLDKGFIEVENGPYHPMQQLLWQLTESDYHSLIHLRCPKEYSLIQTTEESLNRMLEINPDYLNDKEFI